MELKAYGLNTIRTYRNEFSQFVTFFSMEDISGFDAMQIRSYLLYCLKKLRLSENTLHSRINAIKFYYEQVLKKEKIF